MGDTNDVLAILKLYELRRDKQMRDARQWFFSEFQPKNAAEIVSLFLSGERESAHYRMITSYWDMAASFVENGVIFRKTFLDANTEHMVVFAKIQPFLAEMRELIGEDDYLASLEKLVMAVPDADAKLERRRKLLAAWARPPKRQGHEKADAAENAGERD